MTGLVAALLLAAPLRALQSALAADADTVLVVGIVVDATSGGPVAGALLSLGAQRFQSITDGGGRFRLVAPGPGPQRLLVQRFGYRPLELTLNVTDPMPAFQLRIDPDPIQLEELRVIGGARGPVGGVVVDAVTGRSVPFAELWLAPDAERLVGRASADEAGTFNIRDVPTGPYLLRVERLGYVSQYLAVRHGLPPESVEVRLEPDSAVLKGLAEMTGELTFRRSAHGRESRAFNEGLLRASAAPGMRQFLDGNTSLMVVQCPDEFVRHLRNCIELRGATTRPVIYIDGVEVLDPPPPGPSHALDQLASYNPRDFHSLEYFLCAGGVRERPRPGLSGQVTAPPYVEIHAYTYEYMERMARRPRPPLPSCLP